MQMEDQSAVIAYLSSLEAFADGCEIVERATTHISEIFMGKTRVYKLKRAVKYPYLDFSTKDLRLKYCEAEVRLNRRTAPELYLGVKPITQDETGAYHIGHAGRVVDWVVEMVRFDQNQQFDRLGDAGKLDRHMMEHLADNIASFHAHAEARQDGGGRAGIAMTIEGNAKAFAENGRDIVDRAKVATLTELQYADLSEASVLLENRRMNGCVRHCHGDMHLGNIFLGTNGEPVLFDAIEFSEAFATIDVLYDLAFLLMDLDRRGLGTLATVVMNRYMDITGAAWGLFTLPLFLSLRAAIRSHVACTQAKTIDDPAVQDARGVEAREYLDMALHYLTIPQPRLIAVGGLSGSGKSRAARELAPHIGARPGARVVRSDVLRKRIAGVHPLDKLGPEGYTPTMTEKTYRAVYDEARTVLMTGHSVVADCVFSKPEERAAIEAVAKEMDVPFVGLWLEADVETMQDRVETRTKNASDANAEVVKMQLSYDLGDIGWHRVDSSGSREQTDAMVLKILGLDA
ncbi:MAG TPA: AAA family ATPase [Magnetovibrio sp.]